MNILAIIGSPRKGNSYEAAQVMEQRLLEISSDINFEYLFLSDLVLNDCCGCQLCITKGEGKCPLDDEINYIQEKMEEADGIIFITPVYSFQVTALMKKFIDRFAFMVHRPRFFKPALVVVIRGNIFKKVIKYLAKVTGYWGFNIVASAGILELESLTGKQRVKAIKKLEDTASKLYTSIKNEENRPVPSFKKLIWFKMWKNIIENNKENMPFDYQYWQERGWFNSNYYYKTNVNIFKRIVVYIIEKVIKYFIAKTFK